MLLYAGIQTVFLNMHILYSFDLFTVRIGDMRLFILNDACKTGDIMLIQTC